ncbi:alkylphosphonate utilization protein [Aliiglaciecola sp. LCG003]|uniref:PhnA domain-containing protein n=1 Tax=Aliiglaciecola sp. LCG003 TaxID=3053655 RepID=UPI002572425D|nr:alkylphosphonate utilization protein [Aliiglaciecola sp. LCG003]WJG09831.1 PhnA domain-containing protein [Aliiglaciecola sp. LCG003]
MSIQQSLLSRSNQTCELCTSSDSLSVYDVPPAEAHADKCIMVCATCAAQLNGEADIDMNHWRCLNDSMWSTVPAVQVVAWRMLKKLSSEGWAQDLLDMMYLDEEMLKWAEAGLVEHSDEPTLDCNGTILQAGDTVTLVKDLNVKGANFTAKRGTAVRGIGLNSNPEHIEGKINGQRIVIISAFTKKS